MSHRSTLIAIEEFDPNAAAQLLPLVYDEPRKLVASHVANEGPGHTLNLDRSNSCGYSSIVALNTADNIRYRPDIQPLSVKSMTAFQRATLKARSH
jgi:hypothetical protein